ncbi:MAG: F0F1 ATP synthase subunit epsilon [Prevotella nigrescens]|jgi:ATP synthase, delta/epsilon subunit, beta-sandwich domain protein|uniref:ATP synthase F1, epsilon subunit n=2 Tax=Prevotella nigrescens TaxID=28133 RepID=V8CQN1_9BACT|nr:F0F1 ATP synthase subunit epsilon [Prevotella nigrescens]ELX68327.1 ATP synthase F1, epsilon subunit [Prevotella nigrescens F0103]ETD29046.1 ATP synthase F1, epsilon subunit [Prevotella nigrescens CC14M]MBF1444594.1 F0F1 ATP synthase subunit epsilon [Prevotella nigrescens]MBF1446524.1 F0F1 ATP synthase subunit epsilon [Prevotella nigrescens]MBF1453131.1 F0F1 ATP synthase subunit epsilon [Prevotella nigrescens]
MLFLTIISPERILFKGEVENVLVPGEMGEFEILTNHAPIISTLLEGRVIYTIGSEKKLITITGGFVEVKRNEVNLCVEL